MTKTITTEIFTFDELNDDAKNNARQWYLSHNYDDQQIQWDDIKDDAKTIGLRIKSLDQHRANKGEFITSAPECAEKIMSEHGKNCETYKTAQAYLKDIVPAPVDSEGNLVEYAPEWEEERENQDHEFLQSLLEDYRIMLEKNYEYIQSEEHVEESIIANGYTFTEDGKRFG